MKLEALRLALAGVSVYRKVLETPVAEALCGYLFADRQDAMQLFGATGNLMTALVKENALHAVQSAVESAVLADDNPYTRALAAGKTPDVLLEAAAKHDFDVLRALSDLKPEVEELPGWETGKSSGLFISEDPMAFLSAYHRENGCGIFAAHHAFLWKDGLRPIENGDPITLEDLKDYKLQRAKVLDNTESFLAGHKASNMLLYGDRGTGKSSTVHAILNAYHTEGLRMVELPKEHLTDLPRITAMLSGIPLKFILFIDDLSFAGSDDSFNALKAALEGSLAARPENLLIYATSNRRHLVREMHSDRMGDEVHAADTMNELWALSDRFGITVTFTTPNKDQYLSIVLQLAEDRRLPILEEDLCAAAERWVFHHGGRSPRVAKQFIDFVQSRILRGLPIE